MSNTRNSDILSKIIQYCDEISDATDIFGITLEALQESTVFKNAVAMCILQIGELTTHLTDDFRTAYSAMPWQDIKGMRNIAAHNYGNFDMKILHKTIVDKIPELRQYCEQIMAQYQVMEQDALPPQEFDLSF